MLQAFFSYLLQHLPPQSQLALHLHSHSQQQLHSHLHLLSLLIGRSFVCQADHYGLQSVATTDSRKKCMRYSIGRLSTKTGVNIETVRYYERVGLMPPPFRSEGGHRIYDENHEARLLFIRRCRDLGFPIEDVRGLLALADEDKPCGSMRPALNQQLSVVEAKLQALTQMKSALNGLLDNCNECEATDCSVSTALYGCAQNSCACAGTCDLDPSVCVA